MELKMKFKGVHSAQSKSSTISLSGHHAPPLLNNKAPNLQKRNENKKKTVQHKERNNYSLILAKHTL